LVSTKVICAQNNRLFFCANRQERSKSQTEVEPYKKRERERTMEESNGAWATKVANDLGLVGLGFDNDFRSIFVTILVYLFANKRVNRTRVDAVLYGKSIGRGRRDKRCLSNDRLQSNAANGQLVPLISIACPALTRTALIVRRQN
jgi:hypothetical protein